MQHSLNVCLIVCVLQEMFEPVAKTKDWAEFERRVVALSPLKLQQQFNLVQAGREPTARAANTIKGGALRYCFTLINAIRDKIVLEKCIAVGKMWDAGDIATSRSKQPLAGKKVTQKRVHLTASGETRQHGGFTLQALYKFTHQLLKSDMLELLDGILTRSISWDDAKKVRVVVYVHVQEMLVCATIQVFH